MLGEKRLHGRRGSSKVGTSVEDLFPENSNQRFIYLPKKYAEKNSLFLKPLAKSFNAINKLKWLKDSQITNFDWYARPPEGFYCRLLLINGGRISHSALKLTWNMWFTVIKFELKIMEWVIYCKHVRSLNLFDKNEALHCMQHKRVEWKWAALPWWFSISSTNFDVFDTRWWT